MSSVFVIGSLVASCIVSVDKFPRPGESLAAHNFVLEPGGKGFNVLLGLHRLNVNVDGVLPIGDDLFGSMAPHLLKQSGLPDDILWQSPGASGGGTGFIDLHGETSLAVSSGANARLDRQAIEAIKPRIQSADIVVAQFETSNEAITHGFQLARQAGRATFLNPSPYRPLPASLLSTVTTLVVNETEAEALALDLGVPPLPQDPQKRFETLAAHVLNSGPDLFIVTLGALGSKAWTKDGLAIEQPAFSVASIDCLGAGDAFNAGLIAAIIEGYPLNSALDQASVCGALATLRSGTWSALPYASSVRSHVQRVLSG